MSDNSAKATQTNIHPTAYVEPGAQLGEGVTIGAFAHVGPHVVLGDGVEVMSHAVVMNDTTIGANTRIFPHAVIGGAPQNNAYKGERTTLSVGANNVIREGVTMNIGTGNARGYTTVGDNCMFLCYSHVAHDCVLGNNITFANNVMVGGHATIGDFVIIGGGAGVHQFCEIGHHAFIGGVSAVVNDVIPFGMVVGSRAYLSGLNLVGMKRSGMPRTDINALRHAYKELFADNGQTLRDKATALLQAYPGSASVRDMAEFILSDSKRKFMTPLTALRAREAHGA